MVKKKLTGPYILLRRLLGLGEHEVHDDDDRSPKDDLLMPKEHFAIVKKTQGQRDGAGHDPIADGWRFDGCVGPDGEASEINKERHDVDLKPAADGQKHIQKPDEHQRRSDHHADDAHLLIAAALRSVRMRRLSRRPLQWILWRRKVSRGHGCYRRVSCSIV